MPSAKMVAQNPSGNVKPLPSLGQPLVFPSRVEAPAPTGAGASASNTAAPTTQGSARLKGANRIEASKDPTDRIWQEILLHGSGPQRKVNGFVCAVGPA